MSVDPISAIRLSAIVGLACAVLGLPVAIFLGYILARKNFFGKSLLNLIVFFPLVLPPVVTGLLLLKFLGRESLVGGFFLNLGFPITFTLTGAIVASYVVGLPLYVMMVRYAFETVDQRYEEIAMTTGLSDWKIFFKVTLPLAFPGVLAGAVLAFARAMGEFGATSIISGNIEGETRTISTAVYSLLEATDGMDSSRILLLASVALSFLSLAAYEILNRWHKKRLEVYDI